MRRLLFLFAVNVSLATCYSQQPPSNADPNDPKGHNQPYSWAPNSNVTVYIDSFSFPPGSDSAQKVMTAFALDAMAYNTQNVSYNFVQTQSSVNLNGTTNQVYVTSVPQSVMDAGGGGYAGNASQSHYDSSLGYNIIDNSEEFLSGDVINDPAQVGHFVAHEESHNNFLGDCYDCSDGDSLMDENANIDDPGLTQGPTDNDTDAFSDYSGGSSQGGSGPCRGHACPVQDDLTAERSKSSPML